MRAMSRPIRSRRSHCLFGALCVASAATVAVAQGMPNARTGVATPQASAAAVEDSTALMTNPAGLGFVEDLELSLGGFARAGLSAPRGVQGDADVLMALSPTSRFAVGLGTGLSLSADTTSYWWTSGGFAIRGGEMFSAGMTLHMFTPLAGGGTPKFMADVGTQIRLNRFVAFGAVVEGLGQQDVARTTARGSVAVRVFPQLLTLGADVRVIPGDKVVTNPRWFTDAQIVPALNARVELGGLAFGLGASMKNIGAVVPSTPELEVLASAEINTAHVGATLLGGADGLLGSSVRAAGGARLRASSAAWDSIVPDSGRWLALTLAVDGVPPSNSHGFIEQLFEDTPDATAILTTLSNIADDPAIEGVVIYLRGISLGWGRAAELRNALAAAKTAGKKIVVHMNYGDDVDVFVASAADKVYLTPAGGLDLNGLRAQMTYFGDTLSKIGIHAEAVHAGKYKSAPRTFTANAPNDEELEVENAILDSAFATLVAGIATGRHLSVDEVKATIDLGGLTANRALERKIVDGLAYDDELADKLKEFAGHKVHLDESFMDNTVRNISWHSSPKLAIIPVVGTIGMTSGGGGFSPFGGGGAGADAIVDALDAAAQDDSIKAIVLRVDSPGGDALASDLIWRAVMKAKEKKPVLCSMGDLAASGGYYVASAATSIWAEPDTLTGSIGVFGLFFDGEELADKLGVHTEELKRGALPGPSNLRPINDAEREAIQFQIDSTYERFLDSILQGRGKNGGLSREALRELAEGRVWTGAQAKERRLVDNLGGLMDVVDAARTAVGLVKGDDLALVVMTGRDGVLPMPRLLGLAQVLSRDEQAGLNAALKLWLGDTHQAAFLLQHERRALALTPGRIDVK